MMVKLINCDAKLKANFNIDMQQIGAYDALVIELSKILQCWAVGYDYIEDSITFETAESTILPDLSAFGEVLQNDNFMG